MSQLMKASTAVSTMTRVASVRIKSVANNAAYRSVDDWTGPEARAVSIKELPFPDLLAPVDDLPPATLVTLSTDVAGNRELTPQMLYEPIK